MAKTRQPEPAAPVLTANALVRIAGRDAPMHQLVAAAAPALAARGVRVLPAHGDPYGDYAQIDPALAYIPNQELATQTLPPEQWPAPGLGYVGYTPEARGHFLRWLDAPEKEAPPGFQVLYLAHIECCLIDAVAGAQSALMEKAIAALHALGSWPAWRSSEQWARTTFLAYLLLDDGERLARWLAEGHLPPHLVGVALGRQALCGAPLTASEVVNIARLMEITDRQLDEEIVSLRLRSLTESLGSEPMAYALRDAAPEQVDIEATIAEASGDPAAPSGVVAWRCAHRDLRLAFAQPDLGPRLAPLIAEMLDDVPIARPAAPVESAEAAGAETQWTLILEFGHSRSEYFEFALKQAQRLPGYSALVDEQRHVIHRVHIKKSEMRRFWQLWEYAMNWNETHVYVNGKELEKWKIYPYSQFLA